MANLSLFICRLNLKSLALTAVSNCWKKTWRGPRSVWQPPPPNWPKLARPPMRANGQFRHPPSYVRFELIPSFPGWMERDWTTNWVVSLVGFWAELYQGKMFRNSITSFGKIIVIYFVIVLVELIRNHVQNIILLFFY